MRIQNRIKRSTKQYIIVAIICLFLIGGAAVLTTIILTGQIREEYQLLLKEAYDTLKVNERNVYVSVSDITAGDIITKDKLEQRMLYSSLPKESYITDEEINKSALVNIPSGTPVIYSMVTDYSISPELREMEYAVININTNIVSNDTVDIRIFYPNGESYVVLSKKVIKGFSLDNASIFLWMNEEEIQRMSAAIVDSGLYQGSRLYVTKYIEPSIQEASNITYIPSLSILSLIENDPNIIERCSQELNKNVRKALENRLANSINTDISTISWDLNSNNSFDVPSTLPDNGTSDISGQDFPGNSQQPDINIELNNSISDELGDSSGISNDADFSYYAEEEAAKDGDIEYGE
jgi:hypothetical protein